MGAATVENTVGTKVFMLKGLRAEYAWTIIQRKYKALISSKSRTQRKLSASFYSRENSVTSGKVNRKPSVMSTDVLKG